jgi:release factor glutamine methyltransferase
LKALAKYITSKTVQPAVKKYLGKTRDYHFNNITLIIPPGVFHPAFFFSTKILLNYVLKLELNNKRFLELGAGSGLISFVAAGKNALVMATDVNPLAVKYLKINSEKNHLPVQIILSDLFDKISPQQFDIIVINPPYYKKDPKTDADYAWYCGANAEYFYKLFASLQKYMHNKTITLMVLSEDCDITMIKAIATKYYFIFEQVFTKKIFWERNFIFKIILQESYSK